MKKQRNYSQSKEQEKFPERTKSKMGLISISDAKFKKGGNKNAKRIKEDFFFKEDS